MDRISFKSGSAVQVAKHLKGDWLKVMVLKTLYTAVKKFHC